jgi:hypothetical protein
MTPALLHLYQELFKSGGYVYGNPNKSGLHLLVIDDSTINSIYVFGVPEVRRQFLLYLFGPEDLQPTLSQTELVLRQLPVKQ